MVPGPLPNQKRLRRHRRPRDPGPSRRTGRPFVRSTAERSRTSTGRAVTAGRRTRTLSATCLKCSRFAVALQPVRMRQLRTQVRTVRNRKATGWLQIRRMPARPREGCYPGNNRQKPRSLNLRRSRNTSIRAIDSAICRTFACQAAIVFCAGCTTWQPALYDPPAGRRRRWICSSKRSDACSTRSSTSSNPDALP
jgi:hypothetical protein